MAKGSRDAARDSWIPIKALIQSQLVSKAKGPLPGFVDAPTRNFCKVLINRLILMGDEAEKKENTDRTENQQHWENEEINRKIHQKSNYNICKTLNY